MKLATVLATLIAVAFATPFKDDWASFKVRHGKRYEDVKEENFRRSIFQGTLKTVEEHNAKFEAGLVTYRMKINQFADMLPEELSGNLSGFNRTGQLLGESFERFAYEVPDGVDLPESVDWRTKGAVTPVKNQYLCGGCWAFSATGAIEGQLFLNTGKLTSLSEQQLLDCADSFGNFGCKGGLMDRGFRYLETVSGLASEDSYPFRARAGPCQYSDSKKVEGTQVKSIVDIRPGSLDDLKSAVATKGPIAIAINSNNDGFKNYGGGILDGASCSHKLDHGVLLVGYGTENGQDYWLIKNSWGDFWGEEGYLRVARNSENTCGLATIASYPVLS